MNFDAFSASKKKKSKKTEKTETNQVTDDEKTSIAKPKDDEAKKKYTYFSLIPPEILSNAEIASPASLKNAAVALRKSEAEYSENEKVLLSVLKNIMTIAYPTEKADWDTPAFTANTPYIGAIESAKSGIYDTSTGNVDFLTIVLPSLVVLKVNDVSPFFEDAKKALLQGIELKSDSVLAHYLLSVLYSKNNLKNDAVFEAEIAKKLSPECFETSFFYAKVLYENGRIREANNEALSTLEKNPTNKDILRLCAEISNALENYNAAEEYISRVLQQEPNDLKSLLFRARILMAKKDYVRAASLLDIYSRQDSSSKDYLMLRSELQFDWSKNLVAAKNTIETALKSFPDDKDVLLFAARLANSSSSKIAGKTADEYADEVLKKDPENKIALQYAIRGLMKKKDFQKAYELSSSLIEKNKNDTAIVYEHVKICLEINKKDEAWNLISSIYKDNRSDENVIQTYIITLDATSRDSEALSLINELLPSASQKLKSFLYYRRSFLANDENSALSDLRSSLIANPRNDEALFRLYKIYFDKKDYRKAQYYLKQVVALNPTDDEYHKLNDELMRLIR